MADSSTPFLPFAILFPAQFLVSWISVLDSVPGVDLVSYLPEFLDGLFKILSDKRKVSRRDAAEECRPKLLSPITPSVIHPCTSPLAGDSESLSFRLGRVSQGTD